MHACRPPSIGCRCRARNRRGCWCNRNPTCSLPSPCCSTRRPALSTRSAMRTARSIPGKWAARTWCITRRATADIPAWLTLPHGGAGKKLPMVVLVHGGPYVRGHVWGWNANAQFLASRGYAVLEPEFRGSTGYGFDHFKAGWKQWGLAMQNDIADGTRWAIAGGVADPRRICIAGASYGGYATLMGLVNDPELYRCGIDWVGVTDIDLLFSGHWSFSSDLPDDYKNMACR